MDRYEFLKEWYHQENERHLALNESLNIPIGILTGIFAATFFYITGFSYKNQSFILLLIFISCIIVLMGLCFITAYYLILSYNNLLKGYSYKYLPEATKWNEHLVTLKAFYEENTIHYGDKVEENAEKQLKEHLTQEFAKYIDNNLLNNDQKSGYLHKAKQYLFVTLIVTIITFIPFACNFFSKEEGCQKIEVTNVDSLSKKTEKLTQLLIDLQMSKQNVTPPPPPAPPSERIIKEGEQPTPSKPNK